MGGHNDAFREQQGSAVLTLTATATLTQIQLDAYKIIRAVHATVAIALTLPAASAANEGQVRHVCCGGAAAVTVVCTAGFGTVGAGGDTVTGAQGEMITIASDGTAWHTDTLATGDIH